MIPKIIHYCWFGGNPLPEDAKKYIESWRKYCPGYEIKEWNESNFDINCCDYVREAYEAKSGLLLVIMPGFIFYTSMVDCILIQMLK